ncbi:unnamed protein product [Closterium sp. Naga37s-1]|nr:unnamed protein product [Closterium sp. Naga37s-1]
MWFLASLFLAFFLNDQAYGRLTASLTAGLYLAFKLSTSLDRVLLFVSAVRQAVGKGEQYGTEATPDEVCFLVKGKDSKSSMALRPQLARCVSSQQSTHGHSRGGDEWPCGGLCLQAEETTERCGSRWQQPATCVPSARST